jgi:uncharacterized protein
LTVLCVGNSNCVGLREIERRLHWNDNGILYYYWSFFEWTRKFIEKGFKKMVGINDDGMNIWIACSDGNIEQVKKYLEYMAVDSKDENGYTPLHAAASYNHLELIRLLAEHQANLNIQDIDGDTPLHVSQDLETVKLLVQLGADPTIRNQEQRLPIEIAHIERAEEVVTFLKEFTPQYIEYEQDETDEQFEHLMRELESHGVKVSEIAEEIISEEEENEEFER